MGIASSGVVKNMPTSRIHYNLMDASLGDARGREES